MDHFGAVVLAARMSFFNQGGPVDQRILYVYTFMFWTSVVVGAGVAGLILFSAIRFRARGRTDEPRQIAGNTRLEVAWTLIPFLILASLFGITYANMPFIHNAPAGAMQIHVTGEQYVFVYNYPFNTKAGKPIIQDGTMTIPANEPIELDVTSIDVNHSFFLPTLGGQVNAIPGQMNHMWIEARPGTYYGQCTELCGVGHAFMTIQVDALSPAAWSAWLTKEQGQ